MANQFAGFPRATFDFLKDLQQNNNREWFAANRNRYESYFLQPSLALIEALQKPIEKAAPLLRVEAKKVGGSLIRIYKDTRFSRDKTPYKTNIGIQFQHQAGKNVHSPGIYLHIALDECFLAAGIWKPDAAPLLQIRQRMCDYPQAWKSIWRNKRFQSRFSMHEDRLKAMPRGFEKDHPLAQDLKLKSFLGVTAITPKMVQSANLTENVLDSIKASAPLMRFLCEALELPY